VSPSPTGKGLDWEEGRGDVFLPAVVSWFCRCPAGCSCYLWETVRIWREGRELLRRVCKGCISRVQGSCGCGSSSTALLSSKAMKRGSRLRISWEQFKNLKSTSPPLRLAHVTIVLCTCVYPCEVCSGGYGVSPHKIDGTGWTSIVDLIKSEFLYGGSWPQTLS
jgi:hypothetical protein